MNRVSPLRRIVRIALYGVGALFALILIVFLGAASYNAIADARDQRRFKPPGILIEIEGLRMHLHCTGPLPRYGQPTVVLDTGWSMPALSWTLVQAQLQQHVRVCSYDRVGMGFSDRDPKLPPRGSARLAGELHQLLEFGGAQGPYVLVGHSNGGYLVRAFYDRYPKDVVGAVLVDASSEYMDERFKGKDWEKDWREEMRAEHRREPLVRLLQFSGVMRWQLKKLSKNLPFPLRPEVIDEAVYLLNRPGWYPAALAELEGIPETLQQLKKRGGLGELPLIVLTAGKFKPNRELSPEKSKEWNRIWVQELQPQLAHLSTRGRQVIVDSGHLIPFEAPETVVKAVDEVLVMAKEIAARSAF